MDKPTFIDQQRRRILQAGAATSVALLGACASAPPAAKARVVVVGGGWGGLGAVRALAASPAVQVTLLEPNEGFMSCPLSAHYIAGHQPASDFQRSYAAIDKLGVQRVREAAIGIDRAAGVVVTATRRLPFDYLILSPGIEYMDEAVQGFAQAREQLPVGFRAFEQMAVKREVDRFLAEGGNLVISVPKPPYRCPPAPYERAFLIAEQMQQRGTKGKILMIDANPQPMPAPIAAPILNGLRKVYAAQIEYLPDTEVRAVDVGRRVLSTSAGEVPFTAANLILPMRAPALVRQAGLGERWAAVKLPSFESQADSRIYVIGDAQGTPLPKSGHVAFGTGQQVGQQVLDRIAGRSVAASTGPVDLPLGICWASVTHKEAININVSSSVAPGEAPKLKFTVDPAHNARSGAAAMNWGAGMWKAMLG